jgi:pyruvate decarboxylase
MKHLLPKLTAALEEFKEGAKELDVPIYKNVVPQEEGDIITHSWFWPRVGAFFRPKDVVLGETGTSSFGLVDVPVCQVSFKYSSRKRESLN